MALEIKTKYITPDDFKTYFGIDLALELGNIESANAFIMRIENRMQTYLNTYFFEDIDSMFPDFTDSQKQHYRLALLEQAIYVFRNGDISVDSGYDYEQGLKASNALIAEKSLAPNAKQELILCGLCDRAIYKGGLGDGFGFIPR